MNGQTFGSSSENFLLVTSKHPPSPIAHRLLSFAQLPITMNSDGPAAYAASTAPQENDFVFYDRSWQFIPDSNNGSYSSGGNILFDLGQLSGSGRFIDFSQSYLTIPLVLQANFVGPANAAAPGLLAGSLENVFAASLKNIPSLFHSLQVNLPLIMRSRAECIIQQSGHQLPHFDFVFTRRGRNIPAQYIVCQGQCRWF